MHARILGASTLTAFTNSIRLGFAQASAAGLTLAQIHGAPAARDDDRRLLAEMEAEMEAEIGGAPRAFLIHRPDEAFLDPVIRSFFERHPTEKLVFLGDLIFRIPFWAARRACSAVIPHPFLDLSMPEPAARPIVGAFTTWGEMRDVKHYVSLAERLRADDAFEFRIGGAGLDKIDLPPWIHRSDRPFAAHFNVQLYHLHGKKRYGESSGSLHRGISVPVIFEANGAERLEGWQAVRIEADDELRAIDFAGAAAKIRALAAGGLAAALERAREIAGRNTVLEFAKAATAFLTDGHAILAPKSHGTRSRR